MRKKTFVVCVFALVISIFGQPSVDISKRHWGLDIRDFATCDGIADDTLGLQKAINKALAEHYGTVRLSGRIRISSSINLTGLVGSLRFEGESKYSTAILAAFSGGPVFDLTGSTFLRFENFRVEPVRGYHPDEVFLLSRKAGDNSAGDHTFNNLWIDGTCQNASVVLWGSEQNLFTSCLIWSSTNVPALVAAVKIDQAGFTPSSTFTNNGTGQGGVSMNTFLACRFGNETGIPQTTPLLKIYGGLGWAFYNCFFVNNYTNTIELNASSYPSAPQNTYYGSVTFDTCLDESPWFTSEKSTLYIAPYPDIAMKSFAPAIKGLNIRNCSFFDITGATNSWVDGLVYDGGRYSPTIPRPIGLKKINLFNADNLRVAVSKSEKDLQYIIRNRGSALFFNGVSKGATLITNSTGVVIVDDVGNLSAVAFSAHPGPSGNEFEAFRLNRAEDDRRYNSIFSKSDDSGNAEVSIRVHDGLTATSQTNVLILRGNGSVRMPGPIFSESQITGRSYSATSIPVFHGNITAIAGGLRVGDFYRTGDDPDVVCVVH